MQILIVKMSSLGDVLQSFFALQYLKQRYPEAIIDWVVEKKWESVAQAHPDIGEVISVDTKHLQEQFIPFLRKLRKKKYDMVVDLQGNCKSLLGTLFAHSPLKIGFSWRQLTEWPNGFATGKKIRVETAQPMHFQYLQIVKDFHHDKDPISFQPIYLKASEEDMEEFSIIRKTLSLQHSYLVSFSSKWPNKQLNDATLLSTLETLEKIADASFILIYQGHVEKTRAFDIAGKLKKGQIVGDLSLPVLQQIMLASKGFIGIDSSLLHLAFLSNVPTFSIFGPSSAKAYGIEGKKNATFQGYCPFNQVFYKRCPYLRTCNSAPCMKDISPLNLSDQIRKWMTTLHS